MTVMNGGPCHAGYSTDLQQCAADHDQTEMCKFLLSVKADPFLEDKSQTYASFLIASNFHSKISSGAPWIQHGPAS